MHSKLNLKVYGVSEPSDLQSIEENLKLQDAVKNVKTFQLKKYIEVKMDIDENKITKDQVVDIIRMSGNFKIEEQSESGAEKSVETSKIDRPVSSSDFNNFSAASGWDSTKMSFVCGIMFGALLLSILLNLVFGYALFGNNKLSGLSSDKQDVAKAQVLPDTTQPQAQQPPPQGAGSVQEFSITKNDNVRGKFNAPITLVQYSDFECPFSGRAYSTFKKLLSDYPDKVRLVYKHFPLSFHANAQKASESAECAGEQGKFWEYHDKLFENQSSGLSVSNFKQWAADLKLNTNKFNDCLDSGKYASKVQADEVDGQKRGVQGTPATFVNGQLISGAVPYENFKSAIDQLLNKN